MDPAVDHVAGHQEPHGRDVQARGGRGVGSSRPNWDEPLPLQLQPGCVDRLGHHQAIGNLTGKELAEKAVDHRRRQVPAHRLHNFGKRDGRRSRKSLEQWHQTEEMVAVCVGDVDRDEVLSAGDHPVDQRL